MKECPVCHAITEEDERCPVCGQFILYEPPSGVHRESLARNAYTYRYLLRKLWLPVLSLITVIVIMIICWPLEKSVLSNEQSLWPALLLAVLAVLSAVFERRAAQWMEWKYSHEYARMQAASGKYVLAVLALLLAIGTMMQ